ncbi:MAG: hypothetical protein H0X69_08055 [Gemmatimonadales bacterium]|nr:hypothetical protein [Gemmatimonadales bacterium]
MYLVEIEAGREALYESVDALAAAIRRGEVGPQARIFHRASSNWISITLHPEFKKMNAARQSEPLPPLARTRWTFFGVEQGGREIDEPAVPVRAAVSPTESVKQERGLKRLLGRAFRGLSSSPSVVRRK